ncbi:MAG: AsmA-like C-terminal domain-containing protein, partial [Thermodesulfobacteriota bacterium]|nr:AsmA-like C-terminal domain-containing protein [Thermodesulfobacteriota bacterium]
IDLEISTDEDKNWSATFNDLAIIHPRSTLLQQYLLEAGSVTISSKNGKKPYNLSAHIPYRYPFLLKDNKPVEDLNISGKITDKGIKATVNEDLQINYTDRLTVTSEGIGYNIPAIFKFIKERPTSGSIDSHKKNKFSLSLEADSSYLFFGQDSRVLADRIHIEVADGRTLLHLEHGPGHIILEIEGDQLSMEGKELNDTFMSSLIRGTDFQNGRMTMAATGSFDQLSVLFKLNDTIIRNLKSLNNILAFLNTVPALITFSPPEYNTRGLPIRSAIVGMVIKEDVTTFESFEVKSSVLSMTGTGWFSVSKDQIDMDINLITQAKANMNKIPLLGYIVVGNEKRPAITVKISGDLHDPKVKHSVFRKVSTLPFAILFRTLTLPFHLVESMVDHAGKK